MYLTPRAPEAPAGCRVWLAEVARRAAGPCLLSGSAGRTGTAYQRGSERRTCGVGLVTAPEGVGVATATARADKTLWPVPVDERRFALGLRAVTGQEGAQG